MAGGNRTCPSPALRGRGAPIAGAPGALPREFFSRSTELVARDLVGTRLYCDPATPEQVAVTIVEVEAYLGTEDPASHAYRGPRGRAAIMFGPPGHLYVYLSYGMHFCANIVCEPEGTAGAVLLRAAAVQAGEDVVRRRRKRASRQEPSMAGLLRGPGNLGVGLGLSLADNGLDLCDPRNRLRLTQAGGQVTLLVGPRVGISRAAERPLRFAWAGHPAVSRPRFGDTAAQRGAAPTKERGRTLPTP